ncbi:hypothetical protein [Vibrio genomosp. F10]|uniref:Uncharacterized protein n=2 Tax=Vibrio genomosp. F10 TaxID=723171 RepID=A0A1B9R1H0_9VIBR|nr:hypothetical protein [Vibrio genomosp. F10]OCH78159.1 hypothetical protein A6E14_00905 [Vibrio genomosp. F10]OEE30937.1 hypothetical protein A1QO_14620 [Vibrio genomosp. F10 str. ZF-129]OEE94546.1 hypothetical protein A1QM_00715 [Vibrio genomosp. F10 str. 9ZC157]OEE95526.1 hypothetical protein A1QK_15080 [Vibrio genomosp. F10 str. 9ZD137]OEF03878.1 hypothetical protein A1QI_13030 [Vibrio genomosp. F10 str. 9ZB36]
MKASDLKNILNNLPESQDPDIVMGEEWLPERLIDTQLNEELLFLKFDNAPEESQGDEEARGFVEHEITMIRHRFEQIINDASDTKTKADAMVALFLMGHESSSSEIIEILEDPDVPDNPTH